MTEGDNNQKYKYFCSISLLCISFTSQMVKTCMITLQEVEGWNAHNLITFSTLHSFYWKGKQTSATYRQQHMCNNNLDI